MTSDWWNIELRCEGKIVTVWSSEKAPEWKELYRWDAGPDGLSGKREGFYFANELAPFVLPLRVGGVIIRPDEYPVCLDEGAELVCETCWFFHPSNCLILKDMDHIEMTRAGFQYYRTLIFTPRGVFNRTGRQSESLLWRFYIPWKILSQHGRPLHYQTLARIYSGSLPGVGLTDRVLHRMLKINPIYFQPLGDGVYQTRKGIEPNLERITSEFWELLRVSLWDD